LEQRFPRAVSELNRIFSFLDAAARTLALPADLVPELHLIAEELFTNMVRHQKSGTAAITIALEREADLLTMRIVDPDSERFDPTAMKDPDLTLPIEQRRPGGLGVFLTKRIVDELRYDYRDRTSTLTLTKKIRSANA
jgi:serine/threonine-protein kinase RsbW